ncbi:uncharacterized protein BKCO1_3800081 [Diplodia corticola]|uniref:Uncharacterized protein n=1 Tax=Diplodia corticola TaxID=236234 RepID=A0A1J9RYD9_9PEZI|nr:uncharacterized protein BKCO1_3800081 [Diplodia corticola]OJD32461.1 hypothetical protein BKCO1_3800081 [Diplodia corticola]
MAQASPTPPPFDPVDTSAADGSFKDEVESPSLSNSNALVRFEFEAGHGQEGTKIVMVEWEDDDTTRRHRGDWHISWEGKSTVLPADDQTSSDINRLYFLLPPGVPVPPAVTLTHRPADASKPAVTWRTNSLPAIFPPELGATARQAGKKGVLHTIWAKRRLQALQKEIDAEARTNVEGIAFVMAMQEKEWIEQNFGVASRPSISLSKNDHPASPTSPRSPGGGRLMDKLKGLKLGTSEKDLAAREGGSARNEGPVPAGPLSPESSDVAVSSFAAFKENPAVLAARPAQEAQEAQPPPRRVAAAVPPPEILAQQAAGMGSLNAFAGGFAPVAAAPAAEDDEHEDDLFALPISPRSPDMSKSPFSFATSDTLKYAKDQKAS